MEPYLYFDGLLKLTKDIQGDEIVHMGIRPYGFHAGNAMALVVYPFLLCKYLKEIGGKVELKFVVSINDWEQDLLDGPDPRKYPFNIFPKNTSIYYLPDDKGCCRSLTDHWQKVIERNVTPLQITYPGISFKFVRNSELIKHPFCKWMLSETIKDPRKQFEIMKNNSGKETLENPVQYAGAICPECHRAHGETRIADDGRVLWKCQECGCDTSGNIEEFQFWWYHKPMLLARMEIFKMDITLSGGDHFTERDFNIRRAFIKEYAPDIKEPRMLFTPTIIAPNGERMSKSRNNAELGNIPELLKAADGFKGAEIRATEELIIKNVDEKEYSYIL